MCKKLLVNMTAVLVLVTILFSSTFKVYAITVKEIEQKEFDKLFDDKKELTLFLFFTSWCNGCKSAFHEALNMQRLYHNDRRIKVIIISLDNNHGQLRQFATQYNPYKEQIYIFSHNLSPQEIQQMIYQKHIRYHGRIPHMTIFYRDKIIADDTYSMPHVKKFIADFYQEQKLVRDH